MNIGRRLEEMRERLERSKPACMVVMLTNGEIITTDSDDYMGLAGMLDALCR